MPFAYELASHPDLLDMVEGIFEPDSLIYGARFLSGKPARPILLVCIGSASPGAADNQVRHRIALSRSIGSGCMQFVAGS